MCRRDYGTAGETAGAPGQAYLGALRDSAVVASEDPSPMRGRSKIFTLTHLRCENEVIVEAKGRIGFWPMRRPVRYRLGANCDSITVSESRLIVFRAGNLVAETDLRHPSALRWAWLLHPRHMKENFPDRSPRE